MKRKIPAVSLILLSAVVLWAGLTERAELLVKDAADGASGLVQDVERGLDTNLVDRSDIPWSSDEAAHLVGWFGVMLIVGWVLREWRPLAELASGVFAASLAIELMQHFFTSARNLGVTDISANALGTMVGMMAVVALFKLLGIDPVPQRESRPQDTTVV